jgi:two-component system cell cycle response regulator
MTRRCCSLEGGLRPFDGVGRFGGEEFLLVLRGCQISDAVERLNQIRLRFASTPIEPPDFSRNVAISVGVASFEGEQMNADDLIRRADQALHEAKRAGNTGETDITEVA